MLGSVRLCTVLRGTSFLAWRDNPLMDDTIPNHPLLALRFCHEKLRRGDFFPALRKAVDRHNTAWLTIEDESRWLEGRAVAAEVYDYFGDYAAAERCLPTDDKRIINARTEAESGSELEKRRIHLLIALAHNSYRHEDLDSARTNLKRAQERVDRDDRERHKHFGTRARLAYSRGQLARNEQRFSDALKEFSDCCYFASERLRQRTPELELQGAPESEANARRARADAHLTEDERGERQRWRENNQLYTTWVIGKSLAFGMGWVHYMMGNLTAACHAVGAGYTMLRGTEDWIHRAYAQMLLAATERAQSPDDPIVMKRALARVREAENGLAPHPTFGSRAAFETALTFWYDNNHQEALSALERAKKHVKTADGGAVKTARSLCNILVLESRIHRRLKDEKRARRATDEAVERTALFEPVMPRVNALVNSAETDLAFAGTSLEFAHEAYARAERRLDEALKILARHPNPKMEASCHLHRARALHKLDRWSEAQDTMDMWHRRFGTSIEHGFLKTLAVDVSSELQQAAERFVVDSTVENLTLDLHVERLTKFIIQQAMKREKTIKKQAELLGIDHRTFESRRDTPVGAARRPTTRRTKEPLTKRRTPRSKT